MASEYTFEIGETHYKGTTASAKSQFEALHIAMRTSLVVPLEDRDFAEMSIVGFFANVAFEDIERLEELLVKNNVKRENDDVEVGRNLFVDAPQNYYLLIYHVLKENLGGFWELRRPTDKKAAETGTS